VRLHGPDWRDHKRQMRDLIRHAALEQWITIGEPVYGDDKWSLIQRARGCVYPSRWDACPVAVGEAAAIGVPIVATRYPLANFLAARGAIIQVDPSASRIADGIGQVMSSSAAAVGGKAAQVARTDFSWETVARSWLDQLTQLLRPPATRVEEG
jgi:glycosyltransferase involved in cell wall biosynthesis